MNRQHALQRIIPPAAQRPTNAFPPVGTRLIASALAPVHAIALPPMQSHRDNLADESKANGSGVTHFMHEGFGNVIMSAVSSQEDFGNVILSAVSSLVLRVLGGWMRAKADGLKLVPTGGNALGDYWAMTGAKADGLKLPDSSWEVDTGGTGAKADAINLVPTEGTATTLIEIRNLKKSYGLKPVLRGVDLAWHQGERMALLGANGAGKTTLLRILAGLTKPDAGTVTIAGLDCVRDAQQIRRLVGFVGHQPYLYEELTALENLLFFGRMYTVKHARERALYLLQRVGLEKRVQERVSTLSRGQVQRLAWARALLHSPHLLLLDEPDTGLDQDGSELIDALLSEHSAQGGSIVFTTHQLERALQLSDQIVVLGNRRVAYQQETRLLDLAELQRAYREAGR